MFITSKYAGYNRHGEQVAAGLFLILMQPDSYYQNECLKCGHNFESKGLYEYCPNCGCNGFPPEDVYRTGLQTLRKREWKSGCNVPIKAIVRHTSMRQFGQFMMGFARIHGTRVTLSGSYGGDGLTRSVPKQIYERYGVELPSELYQAWKYGGGWNSAGSEAPKMREWALANLATLRK